MDKINNHDSYGLKRLESKNAKNAIIQKLSQDFNLTPIIAEAFYKQVSIYFHQHSNITLMTSPGLLLIKERLLLSIYKAILLLILP